MKKIQKKWMLFIMASVVTFLGIGYTLIKGTEAVLTMTTEQVLEQTGFVDEKFYKCVVTAYNKVNSVYKSETSVLEQDDLNSIEKLECISMEITDFTGLDKLENLKELNIRKNKVQTLDISKNTLLEKIDLSDNKITDLIIHSNLKELDVSLNPLQSLKVKNGEELLDLLIVEGNNKELNLSDNNSLEILNVASNNLTSVSAGSNLVELDVSGNKLVTLDVSGAIELEKLNVNTNKGLTNLDLDSNTNLSELYAASVGITKLDTSKNTMLSKLVISDNKLELLNGTLDLSSNTELTYLAAERIELESLDLSSNEKLLELHLNNNQLNTLDLSGIVGLLKIDVSENQLEELDLSASSSLKSLSAYNNRLHELNISSNDNVESLVINNNSELGELNISHMKKLNFLGANNIGLTGQDINLSPNSELTEIYLHNNQMKSLDISTNNKLIIIDVSLNNITSLNLENKSDLESLNISSTGIGNLNLLDCVNLKQLLASEHHLSKINLSKNINLEKLDLSYGYDYNSNGIRLKELDLRNNKKLKEVDLRYNSDLADLKIESANLTNLEASNTNIKILNLSACENLNELNVSNSGLTSLKVNSSKLNNLWANNNKLTTLDLSKSTDLKLLHVHDNYLVNLIISSSKLNSLSAYNNKLTTLDLSKSIGFLRNVDVKNNLLKNLIIKSNALTNLDASYNKLESLDLSTSQMLVELFLNNNMLSSLTLNETLKNLKNVKLDNNNFIQTNNYKYDYNKIYMNEAENITTFNFIQKIGAIDNNVHYELNKVTYDESGSAHYEKFTDTNVDASLVLKIYYTINYKGNNEKNELVEKQLKLSVGELKVTYPWYYFDDTISVDEENNIIHNVDAGITVKNFKEKINVNSEVVNSVKILDKDNNIVSDDELLGTGYKLQFISAVGVFDEFVISVKGDVNGDCVFDTADLLLIMRHIINKNLITEKVLSLSADYDMNGIINLNDLIKMVKYFSGDGDDNE